jgi:hypothetical protein
MSRARPSSHTFGSDNEAVLTQEVTPAAKKQNAVVTDKKNVRLIDAASNGTMKR